MNLLNIEDLSKSYTGRMLFEGAAFSLQEGEKVGIIGINGTGKSTLLKIIAGETEADEGKITVANHVVIRYLPQNPEFDPETTVLECALGKGTADDRANVPTESDAKTMLTKLGVTCFDTPMGQLSGGQKKRIALAEVLLEQADILLLDEPTNHLDQEMADWLENYLRQYRGTLVMVTHDRYFLDSVCNRIAEVDKGHIYSYEANYSGYLALKAERLEMAAASERKRQTILRNELAWVQRGARARSTKQKARLERYEELKNRQAPVEDGQVELGSIATRMGRTTIELHDICKNYGERKLIRDFSYIFLRNDRIGFIGANGCGKTTLMKLIAGRLQPDSGEIVVGQTIKMGYYTQEIETDETSGIAYMDPDEKVIDYIRNVAEFVQTSEGPVSASKMLERFLFPGEMQYSRIEKLSGGERRRLNLLRVLMESPNVLILDEPTNDLDITTLTILEDYLDSFVGIVIIVSHDRYFLDRTVRRIFAFEEGGVLRQYEGGYSDYRLRQEFEGASFDGDRKMTGSQSLKKTTGVQLQNSADEGQAGKAQRSRGPQKLKMTFKEQREYETIEADMAALEERLEEIEAEIGKNARDYTKLNQLMAEKDEKSALLEEKMDRWMYLEDLAERIKNQ